MRRTLILLLILAAACVVPAAAPAATVTTVSAPVHAPGAPVTDVNPPIQPVLGMKLTPPGFHLSPAAAVEVAKTSPDMQALHRTHHPLQYRVYTWGLQHYEIYFWYHGSVVADVAVSRTGRLDGVWTGPLALGLYARGHYGQTFDSPLVWAGFGLVFLLGLAALRGRSWLDLLDLAAVLSFGVSYVLFDHKHLELAVWLAYPPLLYLMARMLARGRRAAARRRIDVAMPTALLIGGVVALEAARVAVTLMPPMVMDVGYASAVGAYKILHGSPIYYASLGHPDTYGPIAYLAYLPFAAIWHVGPWGYTPAARAATISFDLLTVGALILLGRRLRSGRDGLRLGLILAWLWASCPFTVLGMVKSTNDGLVALLAVLILLGLAGPIRRGVLLGLAAAAKFFPAILLPVLLAGPRDGRPGQARRALAGFVIAVGLSVALFLPPGGIKEMYDHTIGFQLSRTDIFSPWALHPGLAPLKLLVEALVAGLAVALAVVPGGRRSPAQVSALCGALVIAVQLPALHWFYLYIVWFLPFVFVAVLGGEPAPVPGAAGVDAGLERGAESPSEPGPAFELVAGA